jgi:hypothetical protein
MKNVKLLGTLSLVLALAISMSSCLKDDCSATHYYTIYEPVYKTLDEIRTEITVEASQVLEEPGKLYYYQDFLFINDRGTGIHIYDNTDPSSPVPLSFIRIPGNNDLAIRNNILYADNYIDLVTLDISNPRAPQFLSRTEEVFPSYGLYQDLGYLVEYKPTDQVEVLPCDDYQGPVLWRNDVMWLENTAFDMAGSDQAAGAGNNVGIGGSMARFTIMGPYLYAIDDYSMDLFDLNNATQPALAGTVEIQWGIETIFPYQEYLFIGSRDGMFIYDNSDPLNPQQVSVFQHANACDPVFVYKDIAYVTLRDGTECETFTNQLEVVDVTDVTNPKLLATYPMHNPHGLSVAHDQLYICENELGVKVFDATDWALIPDRLQDHVQGFQAYDIITLADKNIAMVIGADGLYQFDISDPTNLKELSVIAKGQ